MSTTIRNQSSLPPHILTREAQEEMLSKHVAKVLEIHSILKIMSDTLRKNPDWIKMMQTKSARRLGKRLCLAYFFVKQPHTFVISCYPSAKGFALEQVTNLVAFPKKTPSPQSTRMISSHDSEQELLDSASYLVIPASLWEFIQGFKNTGDSTAGAVYQYLHDFAKSRKKEIEEASQ